MTDFFLNLVRFLGLELFFHWNLLKFRKCQEVILLNKKSSFALSISSVNVWYFFSIPSVSCGFGHVYWRNPEWKTSFFVQCIIPLVSFLKEAGDTKWVKLSLLQLNPSRPNAGRREKINLNFYFRTSLWCLKSFYEGLQGLHKTFWGTTKKFENKN